MQKTVQNEVIEIISTPIEQTVLTSEQQKYQQKCRRTSWLYIISSHRFGITELPLISQICDVANIMSGQYGGLQTKIKKKSFNMCTFTVMQAS